MAASARAREAAAEGAQLWEKIAGPFLLPSYRPRRDPCSELTAHPEWNPGGLASTHPLRACEQSVYEFAPYKVVINRFSETVRITTPTPNPFLSHQVVSCCQSSSPPYAIIVRQDPVQFVGGKTARHRKSFSFRGPQDDSGLFQDDSGWRRLIRTLGAGLCGPEFGPHSPLLQCQLRPVPCRLLHTGIHSGRGLGEFGRRMH